MSDSTARRHPTADSPTRIAVIGPALLRTAFESLLALNDDFVPAALPEAEVLVELKIVPALTDDRPVVGTFAVVARAHSLADKATDGVYIGLHEPLEAFEAAIRSVAAGVRG